MNMHGTGRAPDSVGSEEQTSETSKPSLTRSVNNVVINVSVFKGTVKPRFIAEFGEMKHHCYATLL